MTPREFKAWFDGFTEAMDGEPNKAQWKRIRARVAEIDGNTVTERIYVDKYWPTYPRWCYTSATGDTSIPLSGGSFNSTLAMNALGRIEASNIGAT